MNNGQLVSIEDENELNFLEEKLERYQEFEYFIGLRKSCGKWTWISNNSIEVKPKQTPWASSTHPDENDTYCAKMYFKLTKKKWVYDDIRCETYARGNIGYICEKHVGCQDEKGMCEIVHISIS